MLSLMQLKNNLNFNRNLDDIISILKITASIQLRQFQAKPWGEERYLNEINSTLGMLKEEHLSQHPLLYRPQSIPRGIAVVTSDEGFLGELNSLLMDAALKAKRNDQDRIIVIGEKGAQYLEDVNENFLFFPGIDERLDFEQTLKLKNYFLDEYRKKVFNELVIIYAEFISITAQHVRIQKLLPFASEELDTFIGRSVGYRDLLIEPNHAEVVEGLVNLKLGMMLHKIFYSSKLSEFSARLMHLESSSQELIRINRQLLLEYFKSVHNLADKRIREIVSYRILRKA